MPYIVADEREKNGIPTMSPQTWAHQALGSLAIMHRPTFALCGHFSGKEGISAARWLKKVEWELEPCEINGQIPPKVLLRSVDLLLTEEAAAWAEAFDEISTILSMEDPSVQAVKRFKSLFQARFPAKSYDSTSAGFDVELRDLVQMKDESLHIYYQRVLAMMHRVGARDRFSGGPLLTVLESTTLDMVIRAFVKGLSDEDVQREAAGGKDYTDRSLRRTYSMAEQARSSKSEWAKVLEGKETARQLDSFSYLEQLNTRKEGIPSPMMRHPANPAASYSSARHFHSRLPAQGQQHTESPLGWTTQPSSSTDGW